jgi:hypothetical protein
LGLFVCGTDENEIQSPVNVRQCSTTNLYPLPPKIDT